MTFRQLLILCSLFFGANVDAAQFQVESGSTSAYFEVGYFGSGLVKGAFSHITGGADFDSVSKTGVADIGFDMKTVETGSNFINNFVKSKKIFDTETYPSMLFHASKFTYQGEQLVGVDGQLTLHGISKPIHLQVKHFVCGDTMIGGQMRYRCSGSLNTKVLRSEFGMGSFSLLVSDEVAIVVELTLERSPTTSATIVTP